MMEQPVMSLIEQVLTFMGQKERDALLRQAEDEVIRLRIAGWKREDFARALKYLLKQEQP